MPGACLGIGQFKILFIYLRALLIILILPEILFVYAPFGILALKQFVNALLLFLLIHL